MTAEGFGKDARSLNAHSQSVQVQEVAGAEQTSENDDSSGMCFVDPGIGDMPLNGASGAHASTVQSFATEAWHGARIPSTSANFGSGYDTIAVALDRSSYFAYRHARRDAIVAVTGVDEHLIPRDPAHHLFFHAADFCSCELQVDRPQIELVAVSGAPIQAGLGSSAAVRLAGILAVATFAGVTLQRDEAFSLLARLEGHPDNAAAAVFGGLVVALTAGGIPRARRLPFTPAIGLQLLVPTYRKASTEALRQALPVNVSRADAVYNLQSQAMLLAGLLSGDVEAIGLGCHDRLHQALRASLMPGVADVLALRPCDGFIGAVISGAGPTMLLIHDLSRPDACLRALAAFRHHDPGARLMAVTIGEGYSCMGGNLAELIPLPDSSSSVCGCRPPSQGVPAC
ncbi:MAG: homoserine kinase [Acidobacteria bacterium]|nr:homoserine kinase [Acidobacteriota bacterium]